MCVVLHLGARCSYDASATPTNELAAVEHIVYIVDPIRYEDLVCNFCVI